MPWQGSSQAICNRYPSYCPTSVIPEPRHASSNSEMLPEQVTKSLSLFLVHACCVNFPKLLPANPRPFEFRSRQNRFHQRNLSPDNVSATVRSLRALVICFLICFYGSPKPCPLLKCLKLQWLRLWVSSVRFDVFWAVGLGSISLSQVEEELHVLVVPACPCQLDPADSLTHQRCAVLGS